MFPITYTGSRIGKYWSGTGKGKVIVSYSPQPVLTTVIPIPLIVPIVKPLTTPSSIDVSYIFLGISTHPESRLITPLFNFSPGP